jgi:hypothetical protein
MDSLELLVGADFERLVTAKHRQRRRFLERIASIHRGLYIQVKCRSFSTVPTVKRTLHESIGRCFFDHLLALASPIREIAVYRYI